MDSRKKDAIQTIPRDSLKVLVCLVIRLRPKRFKKSFNGLLQDTWVKVNFKKILNNKEQAFINSIHIKKGLVSKCLDIIKRLE